MTNYKRGDIVLVLFPNSDLQTFKKRPALIVQADDLDTGIDQVIVALVTSNLARGEHKSRIVVLDDSAEFAATGLRTNSVFVTDNLATVRGSFLEKVLGSFSRMELVDAALAHTFGLKLLG
jgi:mRNA interferase MazF